MRIASLASGSRGNALVVEAGGTRLMLDCGLAPREIERRLARLELVPADIDAILLTHEHSDHADGALAFAGRHGVALWLTHGTWRAIAGGAEPDAAVRIIDSHTAFAIGSVEVRPFPVPHDAREPAQFVFSDGAKRVGVLTDTGTSTPHIEAMLTGCAALVLECNHDARMLSDGTYPAWLKSRIGGAFGHLANETAARLLAALDTRDLQHIVAAHLSQENNTPALAREALAGALNCATDWIGVADQDDGFDWRSVS
ncbi:MAG: MBL fold metallo-hydrolase [Betaproteobacteria bacterium]|jgi:phosphoribosyl 1,2-cyclic phosphodiesterase|nr:MBL fold metallo-hydrolase [Betaproteobacteria bacterium]